jgi:hypothetical protein
MPEQRWRPEGGDRTPREGGRAALTLPPRRRPELIDLRDAPARAPRRFAPYHVPETDRDALVASALAAHQTASQAPSVLDVDAASLRLKTPRARPEPEPQPEWTPPVLVVDEPPAAAMTPAEVLDDDGLRRRSRVSTRGRWLAAVAAVGLLALLGGGIGIMLMERDDQSVDPSAAAVPADEVADPALLPEDGLAEATGAQAPLASVEGKLTLTDATLHDRLAGGSAPPSTSFGTAAEVILYLSYAAFEPEEGDRLGVIWYLDATEVGRSDVALRDGTASTFVAAPPLDQPGAHRADVTLNDQVVASIPFGITP